MKRIGLIISILVVGGIAASLWFWHDRNQKASTHRLVLFGNVDIRQVQLSFNDSERITALLVQEGDRVEPGQLLATLDARRFAASAAEYEAKVAAQRQLVARLEAGNRPQEIRKAKADMEAAEADMKNAQLSYNRVSDLVVKSVDTQQRADDARAALEVTRARLAAAKETYDLMVIGPREEDIAAAKATLQANEAELVLAQQDLTNAKLYAPTNGVIQDRILEPGDMATPQKPVFTLALNDPVWVRAYVPETDLGRIRLGMKATVTTDSFPGKHYAGWVGFISPTAEFTPKTVETAEVRTKLVYQVRVFVRNPQDELRLGMPTVVTIALDQFGTPTNAAPASGE
jgi:HlyD family secretion protein